MNAVKHGLPLFGVLMLLLPAAITATELTPHAAEYKIRISILSGTLRSRVYSVGGGYMARSIITPTGLASVLMNGSIVEQSEFVTRSEGIRPQHYQSVDTLSKDNKTMSFRFDWDTQALVGAINEEDVRFELDGPVHDRVSIQYELMHNLLNDEEAGNYTLFDGDELKELTVTNIGTRRVKVPFGTFDAVGIQHQKEDSSRVSTLWCVRELGYLPVIIEQHRKGKRHLRAELTDYRPVAGNDAEVIAHSP